MPAEYTNSLLIIVIFIALAVILPIAAFIISRLLRPHHMYREKGTTYESGSETVGTSWVRFNIKYYMFALLFVLFDVEILFLFPWALVFDTLGWFVLVEMFLFIFLLVLGLIFAWRKKVLEWK